MKVGASFRAVFILFSLLILNNINCGASEESEQNAEEVKKTEQDMSVEVYQRLLRQKRMEHRKAVTRIAKMEQYEKQYQLVQQTFEKMYTVMTESRVLLTESGYMPGDPIPTEDKRRDAFSFIMENTGFFGDILLKLPDISHNILKKKKEWDLIFRWGVGFCNESGVLETKESKVLNLVAQELGVIEKSPDFNNPYKKDDATEKKKKAKKEDKKQKKKTQDKKKDDGTKNIEKIIAEKMAEFNKKMQKEGKGGPKLSLHTEL